MQTSTRTKWLLSPLVLLLILIGIYLFSARFKGIKQKVSFKSDINIEGVLIRPNSPGPHPAILLLHGAGDSHQGHNKFFFRFHANAFLKKGFAVLAYTKRGSGKNDINYNYFTYEQLLNDAYSALQFLRAQEDIDQNNIGLMGVSESGWFTPELASKDGNIRFIINRVSSPFTVRETVIHERKNDALNEGFSEKEIEENILPLTRQIWQYYVDVSNDPSLSTSPERGEINKKLKIVNSDDRLGKWFISDQLSNYDSLLYATRGQNWAYDPLPFLKKINAPMLYVMGGEDINMPTKDIEVFLNKFRNEENKDITVKVYPEASHYLYKWGLEDGPYEGWLYQDGYLDLLTDWAQYQLR